MNINPQLIIRRLVDGNDELLIPARDLQITDEASTFKREGFLSVGKTTNRIVDHLISLLPFFISSRLSLAVEIGTEEKTIITKYQWKHILSNLDADISKDKEKSYRDLGSNFIELVKNKTKHESKYSPVDL